MSIAPPSDIILDVAQAADPARRQSAVQKLAQAAAGAGVATGGFEGAMTAAQPGTGVGLNPALAVSPLWGAGHSQVTAGHGSPYQKFEALMLQSFVETMLPKQSELWGDAASADMGRSLFAQKIAEELAKSGKIGIAKSIERFEAKVAQAAPLSDATVSGKAAGG